MKERLVTYINSLNMGNGLFLEGLEEDAKQARIPIIRKETQQLLKLLLAMNCPERILEIGTAVGFSALLMELGTLCPFITAFWTGTELGQGYLSDCGIIKKCFLIPGSLIR